MADFKAGTVIEGKYRLEQKLGEGGIGTVWSANQELVQRKVAVKFLKGVSPALKQRFLVEAQALGKLNHPNCITIHDFGYSDDLDVLYLVMEFLEGETLREWSEGRGSIPFGDLIAISKQIATAFAYAHHQGVYHRDIKPDNVFLARGFTGELFVKVLDFGMARMGEQTDPDARLT